MLLILLTAALGPWTVLRAAGPKGEFSARELAAGAEDFFRRANEMAVDRPQEAEVYYRKALRRYERLLEAEEINKGRLYYNIGNCYSLLDDLGRAVLNYRRAEHYLPHDPNLSRNLADALGKRRDGLAVKNGRRALESLLFFHYDLSGRARTVLFAAFYLLFWGLLCLRLYGFRYLVTAGLVVSLAGLLLFGGSLAADRYRMATDNRGVIIAGEVVARKGDGPSYHPSFETPLHAGTEFELLAERGGWWHIELADGRRCWVPSASSRTVNSRR